MINIIIKIIGDFMPKKDYKQEALALLNDAFKSEMGGVLRYMHYSFMIMGHNRIPIQKWFRDQATESMDHATIIGEKITSLGGHPALESAQVKETKTHSVDEILKESLSFEEATLELYKKLSKLAAENDDMAMEELAREFVLSETTHIEEVQKMLNKDK
jgi:bacterioferritin